MIKPTRRAVLLFASGLPPALIVVIAEPALWTLCIYYTALVLLAMAADALLAFPSRALAVDIKPPARIYIGEQDKVAIAIAPVRYSRPTRFELLLEQRGNLERPEIAAIDLAPGQRAELAIPVIPTRRGLAHIDRLWLRWEGPLSLVQITRRIEIGSVVEITPNIRGARSAVLQFIQQEAVFGDRMQEKGEGTEFEALREYQPGHDIRFMDWKRSAKHRKLLTKEFRTERNHHIILAFDTGHLMVEPLGRIPRLDHVINAALPLAWIGLRSGDLVGTFGFDAGVRHYQQPLRGTQAFPRIQRATAELDYHHTETNFTLGLAELTARLKRRALVVLFTDFVDTITAELLIESLQRMARRHAVIFVTLKDSYLQHTVDAAPDSFADVARAVIAQDFLNERSIVFERLARMGVHCLDVPKKGLSMRLVNRYLQIKQRGLI